MLQIEFTTVPDGRLVGTVNVGRDGTVVVSSSRVERVYRQMLRQVGDSEQPASWSNGYLVATAQSKDG